MNGDSVSTENENSKKANEMENNTTESSDTNAKDEFIHINDDNVGELASITQSSVVGSGIFPAARARLASLRDLGAKKIGALKLKLIENKIRSNERCRQYINGMRIFKNW